MAREENNASQQTAPKVMNEKKFNFQFCTASEVTNRGSKICVKTLLYKTIIGI